MTYLDHYESIYAQGYVIDLYINAEKTCLSVRPPGFYNNRQWPDIISSPYIIKDNLHMIGPDKIGLERPHKTPVRGSPNGT